MIKLDRKNCALTRVLIIIGGVLYYFLIIFAYEKVMADAKYFAKYLYYSEPASIHLLLISFIFCIFPLFWIPVSLRRPSLVVYWLLYLLFYFPSQLALIYSNIDIGSPDVILFQVLLFITFLLLGLIYYLPLTGIPIFNFNPKSIHFFIYTLCVLFIIIIHKSIGFPGLKLNLLNVYTVRFNYKNVIENQPIIPYLVSWLGTVIFPVLISIGFVRNRLYDIVFGLTGVIYIFSLTGQKSILFTPLLIIIILIIWKLDQDRFGLFLIIGICGIVLTSILLYLIWNQFGVFNIFVRRLILTPGLHTSLRIDFFYENPKANLAYSIFKPLINNPYKYTPAKLVGLEYFRDSAMHANANYFADAYSNFGVLGLFIITCILGSILYFIDSLSIGKERLEIVMIITVFGYVLANTALQTALVTHGFLLTILLIVLLPGNKRKQNKTMLI